MLATIPKTTDDNESDHAVPDVAESKQRPGRKRILWIIVAIVALGGSIWFAWNQGLFDPNDHKLVQAALEESKDDLTKVQAVIDVFDEQVRLKQTGWRRRHGPSRYAIGAYTDGLEPIMQRDPPSAAARLAAIWIVRHDNREPARRSISLLQEHHLLDTPSKVMIYQPYDEAGAFLSEQIERHQDPSSRAQAQLALAKRHLMLSNAARDAADILALDAEEQAEAAFFSGGLAYVKLASKLNPETERLSAVALIHQLQTVDEDLLSPEDQEKREELVHKHITFGIGAEAPEIIGKDLDGNTMRLSDYRGKVVLLDFWGHW